MNDLNIFFLNSERDTGRYGSEELKPQTGTIKTYTKSVYQISISNLNKWQEEEVVW